MATEVEKLFCFDMPTDGVGQVAMIGYFVDYCRENNLEPISVTTGPDLEWHDETGEKRTDSNKRGCKCLIKFRKKA